MTIADLQLDILERLTANTDLTAVDTFVEFDPRKTPAELAAQEAAFERVMLTKGLAIVILSPYGRPKDAVRRAVAWAMTTPVAVIENLEVNRSVADPTAEPPRAPLGVMPLVVQQQIIRALLPAYTFPGEAALERPTIGADGLVHYHLLPARDLSVF